MIMDIPSRTDSTRSSSFHVLPSIKVDGSRENQDEGRHPFRRSFDHHTSPSTGGSKSMPIPNARDDRVPPALPPPKFIDPDIVVQFGKSWHEDQKSLPSINPGSSLLGGFVGPRRTDEPRKAESIVESPQQVGMRRESVRHLDEGYASLGSYTSVRYSPTPPFYFPLSSWW